jgi:hypothetical protein
MAKLRKGVEGATIASVFKVDKKHVTALVRPVMEAARHAHDGVRSKIVAWKGERPETLEAAKEEIKAQCKVWLKDEGRRIIPQSVYNVQSELIGCLNGYISYAGMTDAKRKHFDKEHAERTSYHSLVKFLRETKRNKRVTPKPNAASERIKSGWKNHKGEQMKKAKDMLRYAPTEQLMALVEFAESLIKARTKEASNVKAIRKAA